MAGTLTPTPYQTVLDGDGVAVSGAKIYTYVAGTTTNATTYTSSALSSANTNPIVADSAGRYVAYLSAGANLRFIIKTSADVLIDDQDNVQSVPGSSIALDIEGTVGEAVTAGQVVYLSSAAESPALTAGKWYLTDSDAAVTSTSPQSIGVAVSAIAINTAGTIRLAGEVNSAGTVVVGTTYYVGATPGAIVTSAPANSRQVGVGLTSSSLLLAATTAVASTLPNPITQNLLFVDNTYDIGQSGASRPRDVFASRNAVVGADLTVTEDIVVSGAGPHAFGAATNDYTRFYIAGNYASGGASTALYGTYHAGALTGHSGDSAGITGMRLDCSTVTAGNATLVSQLSVHEPQITVGSGAVDNSASVYIQAAATEATNDYALWVDSGLSRFDGNVAIGGTDAVSLLDVRGPTGTGAAPAGVLTLATNELTIVDNDQLGRIEFRSPIATAGTDAIVTAASIWAEANATFSATVNAADIVFATAASGAATEKMRITSAGLVGINIAAPDGTLHVQTATAGSVTAGSGADDLVIESSGGTGMTFLSPSGDYLQTIAFGDVGDADSGRITYDHDSNLMKFWTEGSQRMSIDSTGEVGIGLGSTLPDKQLEVGTSSAYIAGFNSTATNGGTIEFERSGTRRVVIGSQLLVTGAGTNNHAVIGGAHSGDGGNLIVMGNYNQPGSGVEFVNGTIYPMLDANSYLGHGSYRWHTVFASVGTINTSDEREKRDIVESSLGLDFVKSLRPVSYRWRDPVGIRTGDTQFFGLIAQDVDEVAPPGTAFVSKENPDSWGLSYGEFTAPIIKAIQELSSRVQELEASPPSA